MSIDNMSGRAVRGGRSRHHTAASDGHVAGLVAARSTRVRRGRRYSSTLAYIGYP